MIKVITGIRRCGKSTLMELFQAELRLDGVPDSQIIAVNLEDFANIELRDPMKLHAYILSRAGNERAYVFLDEIQNVRDFPPMIDSLFLRKNLDLYLTGSNAYMLSGELATHLSAFLFGICGVYGQPGRPERHIPPLSGDELSLCHRAGRRPEGD